jgi:hypothetical protein
MKMQEIVDTVRTFEGSLVVLPREGSDLPELAWGDAFFYYSPDGVMPERTQPYATIITKDYPEDATSDLSRPGRFRVNIHVGRERAATLVDADADAARPDSFAAHPLYGAGGWVSVVNPGALTAETVVSLLREAHNAAQARAARRADRW